MAAILTAEEVGYVVGIFLRTHPWVGQRIRNAADDCAASRIAQSELRNSGFSHLLDAGTQCPSCGRIARRDPDHAGWFCESEACELRGAKFAETDDRGWSADGLANPAKGITVTRTPRLGDRLSVIIGWATVQSWVRNGAPREQLDLFS